MRIALYVTCLVDLLRPSVGLATLRLLESLGCDVVVPAGQTCCGQPAWSAGDRAAARRLAEKTIAELEPYEHVVIPSGSCTDHLRNGYPELFAGDAVWTARAAAVAGHTRELTQFLTEVLAVEALPGAGSGSVTYHDSCKGLRGLGIQGEPRALLARAPGLRLVEMAEPGECCGFGGVFAERFGDISTAIADRKCEGIAATGADVVAGGDLGCLLNIEGRLRRRGDERTRVLHIAELLVACPTDNAT